MRIRTGSSAILVGIAFVVSGPGLLASAQEGEAQEGEARQQRVVVTGSRIARSDLDTVFPTISVDFKTIEKNSFTNLSDALTEIPSFGTGIDPLGDQGSNIGANFVNFLDLGVQRTLTLVNNRRFVSSDVSGGSLGVDYNVIPLALVERLDIISVGGAPIYGSDAIAGTINVILKDDFEGFQARFKAQSTGRGDVIEYSSVFVGGVNSLDDRANITFSVEYNTQEGLERTARPEIYVDAPFISEVPAGTDGFTDIDADGDGTNDGVFRAFNSDGGEGRNVQLISNGGIISPGFFLVPSLGVGSFGGDFFQFAPNGDLIPFEAGKPIPGDSIFYAQGGTQNDFGANVIQIRSPLERLVIGSTARYDVRDNIRLKMDMQIANTKAAEVANQGGFQTFAFPNGFSSAVIIPVSHPLLSDQARGVLSDLGLGDEDTFYLQRFHNDLVGSARRDSESFLWRISGGLEGEFDLGKREFTWSVSAVAGEATNETNGQPIINDVRFLNALEAVVLSQNDVDTIAANANPIGAVGDIVCKVTRDYARGDVPAEDIRGLLSGSGLIEGAPVDVTACLPINLFGEGAASPAALDYLVQTSVFSTDIGQSVLTAYTTGDLIQLPAGWLSFAAGYETRREDVIFQPAGADQVSLGRRAEAAVTRGDFSTQEFSGELYMPLVSPEMGLKPVHTLEAEFQIRHIDNSRAGQATVWTAGGSYAPIPDIVVRGNVTRSVRAPTLTELFQPIVTSFSTADDPCDMRFITDDKEGGDGNRATNCATDGIPAPFTSNVVNATARGLAGGNPDLANEIADAYSIGVLVRPRFAEGLIIKADFIDIRLEDAISVASLEANLESCYDSTPADFATNLSCDAFTRDAGGQVIDFKSGQTNADNYDSQFLSFEVDYDFELNDLITLVRRSRTQSDLGTIEIDFSAFHVLKRDIKLNGVQQDNTIGSFTDPRWSGTFDLTWSKGPSEFFWRVLWQDRRLFDPSGNNYFADANDNLIDSVPGRIISNISFSYDLSDRIIPYDKPVLVRFNIYNLFDRKPGRGLDRVFGNFGSSDIFGRSFSVNLRADF